MQPKLVSEPRRHSVFRRARAVQDGAALALAMSGDVARAQSLADDLGKRFPEDTIVQFSYLPTLRTDGARRQRPV